METDLEEHRLYQMEWNFERIQLSTGEINLVGAITYRITNLEEMKAMLGFRTKNEFETLMGYKIKDCLSVIISQKTGHDLIENRSVVLNQLQVMLRTDLPKWGADLVDLNISQTYFWGPADE